MTTMIIIRVTAGITGIMVIRGYRFPSVLGAAGAEVAATGVAITEAAAMGAGTTGAAATGVDLIAEAPTAAATASGMTHKRLY